MCSSGPRRHRPPHSAVPSYSRSISRIADDKSNIVRYTASNHFPNAFGKKSYSTRRRRRRFIVYRERVRRIFRVGDDDDVPRGVSNRPPGAFGMKKKKTPSRASTAHLIKVLRRNRFDLVDFLVVVVVAFFPYRFKK